MARRGIFRFSGAPAAHACGAATPPGGCARDRRAARDLVCWTKRGRAPAPVPDAWPVSRGWQGLAIVACCAAALAACERGSPTGQAGPGGARVVPVFEAGDALVHRWRHVRVWGENDWRLASLDGEIVIDTVGQGSSSGLARWVEIDTGICPVVEWSWRVDALPRQADLAVRDREDLAASVIFVFGNPGSLGNPKPVPTLRYVWANANNEVGQIVDSPYFPGTLRSIVVRSGADAVGQWVTERRNLRADYRRAFGEPPSEAVEAFALFTDNDHLEEPAAAQYRWARLHCSDDPGEVVIP